MSFLAIFSFKNFKFIGAGSIAYKVAARCAKGMVSRPICAPTSSTILFPSISPSKAKISLANGFFPWLN